MLCFEGIALNLNVFLQRRKLPEWSLRAPANGQLQKLIVKEEVKLLCLTNTFIPMTHTPKTMRIRPLVSGAILRNIKFTKDRYDSFIALQDKLHQNLARQRTLVSIGTHDLDKIKGPFTYEALPPEHIQFVPLNQSKEMNAAELMSFYEVRP